MEVVLPPEIWGIIFRKVPILDLIRAARTSKYFCKIIYSILGKEQIGRDFDIRDDERLIIIYAGRCDGPSDDINSLASQIYLYVDPEWEVLRKYNEWIPLKHGSGAQFPYHIHRVSKDGHRCTNLLPEGNGTIDIYPPRTSDFRASKTNK